jgi:hypothetical protein
MKFFLRLLAMVLVMIVIMISVLKYYQTRDDDWIVVGVFMSAVELFFITAHNIKDEY